MRQPPYVSTQLPAQTAQAAPMAPMAPMDPDGGSTPNLLAWVRTMASKLGVDPPSGSIGAIGAIGAACAVCAGNWVETYGGLTHVAWGNHTTRVRYNRRPLSGGRRLHSAVEHLVAPAARNGAPRSHEG
eukprot:CAMPEP_0179842768 /NCGR_PEP_ID=MMETSP0982-20121206/3312_1 /TAXON_ID=483367 /ORGANISM="non described non described, Strain CCMP 2436" /LENGTH=128 /DNA_ID=CAMNT_0021727081 /DNA_START=1027 /DNA_END=1412 /DNA_ORIENTATION=-